MSNERVVGLDALPAIAGSESYTEDPKAQMISKAVSDYSLASERSGWVLMLRPKGRHVYQRIG